MHSVIESGLVRNAVRVIAWLCVTGVALLSLIPGDEMIRTGFDGRLEHFVAYASMSLIVMLAFASRFLLATLAILLVFYAGGLEMAQVLSPGRHPSVWDFGASSLGVLIGTGAYVLLRRTRGIAIRAR